MEILSKPIKDFEDYSIDINGNVFGQNKKLVWLDNGYGYKKIGLYKNGRMFQRYVHRLVAETFIGPLKDKQVNHKDGNKSNNNVDNLEIVSAKENTKHALKLGLRKRNIKVLTEDEVLQIQFLLTVYSTKIVAEIMKRSQRCIQYIKRGQHMGKFGFKNSKTKETK